MVSSAERLSLTLFLAGLVHAIIILGLGFDLDPPRAITRTLEIALIKNPDDSKPKQADFLAQENQRGAGENTEIDRARQASMPQPARREQPSMQQQQQSAKRQDKRALVQKEAQVAIAVSPKPVPEDAPTPPTAEQLMQQRQEIARLMSDIQEFVTSEARRPRKLHINSINAQKSIAASYEAAWQQKVERIGNLNYPGDVRRRRLSGTLILSVELNADGQLQKITINRRSGHRAIDDAAVNIVKMASPFAPFPPALRQDVDVLVITRTWQFLNQGGFKTR